MRMRNAVDDTLSRMDLMQAGAGAYVGAQAGPLVTYLPPLIPARAGAAGADPPGTFANDRITLLYVPPTSAETTLTADLTPDSSTMTVAAEVGCASGANLCGFAPHASVLVFDGHGRYGLFTVTSVQDGMLQLTVARPPGTATATFATGAKVVEAVSRTYALRIDATTGAKQLSLYEGTAGSDVPVLDHVVGLSFDYFGDPAPPAITRPDTDESGPWTTYGPKPPDHAEQPTGYPPGENCAFARDGDGEPVSRLEVFGEGPALVRLTAEQLTDGPWCPDELSANRWDADLLRVRRVAVTVRVEAARAALRGPSGPLFVNAGSGRGGCRWVPDQEIHFEIAPRNLKTVAVSDAQIRGIHGTSRNCW